jgi:hypothetical protein
MSKSEIKRRLKQGKSKRAIARELDLSYRQVNNVAKSLEPNEFDPTNQKLNELEGQLLATKKQLQLSRKQLETCQREGNTISEFLSEFRSHVRPLSPPKVFRPRKVSPVKEDAVLLLSDGHWDTIVESHTNHGIEEFNIEVATARAEKLVGTIVDWCSHNVNHTFERLWVLNLGDMINGEIHGAEEESAYRNVKKSSLMAGQLVSLILHDLAESFPEIKYVGISGNHGRNPRSGRKDFHHPARNWDYLVSKMAQIWCRDISNIEFQIPESFTAMVEIRGWTFHLSHGDDVLSYQGIPYYGLKRKTQNLVALNASMRQQVHGILMGHFHQPHSSKSQITTSVINGCWPACDPYSFESFSAFSEPEQLLFGVHDRHPITWRLPVEMKRKNETASRYRISIV